MLRACASCSLRVLSICLLVYMCMLHTFPRVRTSRLAKVLYSSRFHAAHLALTFRTQFAFSLPFVLALVVRWLTLSAPSLPCRLSGSRSLCYCLSLFEHNCYSNRDEWFRHNTQCVHSATRPKARPVRGEARQGIADGLARLGERVAFVLARTLLCRRSCGL